MKINVIKKVGIKALLLILTITIICSSFSGCGLFRRVAGSRAEIERNIERSVSRSESRTYVANYLNVWGLPRFDMIKFVDLEADFITYYNYEGGLPDRLTHAVSTARLFLDNYYDTIDKKDKTKVTDALLDCYVAALADPYAIYRPPTESEIFSEDMTGTFGGIGVMVEQNSVDQSILITSVYENSPAERAGVLRGDYIWAVDGKTLDQIGFSNAVDHIRGKVGTSVSLTLLRNGEFITCTMVREIVEEINASYEFDPESKIGYVRIVQFKTNTFPQFKKCIDELEALGARGYVFDVRGNPGGYVSSVGDVMSYLLPTDKTILSYQYKGMAPIYYKSTNDGDIDHTINVPMVVICDEYTASAGEIFTAAIRDYRNEGIFKATIVGTTTFKKGIMQNTFFYDEDGSSMTFTIAYYNPPCGVNYHGIGVTPDKIVENNSTEDLQLKAAYEELEKLLFDN